MECFPIISVLIFLHVIIEIQEFETSTRIACFLHTFQGLESSQGANEVPGLLGGKALP